MSTHKIVPAALAAAFALFAVASVDAKPTAKPNVKPPKVKPATAHTVKPSAAKAPKTMKVKTHGTPTAAHTAGQVKPQPAAKTKHASRPAGSTPTMTLAGDGSGSSSGIDTAPATRKPGRKTAGSGAGSTASADIDTAPLTRKPGRRTAGSGTAGSGTTAGAGPTAAGDIPFAPAAPLSKAQQKLIKNPKLQAKMASRLPEGINPLRAASGFKNLGQFVACVNASNNQGIDFLSLRSLMVGPDHMSLGQAIQHMKGVDPQTAAGAANVAVAGADRDIATAGDVATTKPKTKRRDRS